jgi:diacylglycerol diphosphate phosphatase/phosphatidate phosphatase
MSKYSPSMPALSIAKPSHPPHPRPSLAQRLRMPDQPTFRTFARLCWLDILTQLLCTAIAFLLYKFVPPLAPKWFPVFPGMQTSAVGLRYGKPYLSEYVTTLVSAIVSFFGPLAIILLVGGLKVKSFWDVNSAVGPFSPLRLRLLIFLFLLCPSIVRDWCVVLKGETRSWL